MYTVTHINVLNRIDFNEFYNYGFHSELVKSKCIYLPLFCTVFIYVHNLNILTKYILFIRVEIKS